MSVKIPVPAIIITGLLIMTLIFAQRKHIDRLSEASKMLAQNELAFKDGLLRYNVSDSLNAVGLYTSFQTVKQMRAENSKLLSQLRVDMKRVNSVGQVGTKTEYVVEVPVIKEVHDTVHILSDRCFDYSDRWLSIDGCISPLDKLDVNVHTFDTLVYVEHIVPKKFLFFRWGVKERRQEIVSLNPHVTISDATFKKVVEKL